MATNSYCLDLELDNQHYAYCADDSALSITGDITIECWVKFESSSTGMDLVSKWKEDSDERSYSLRYDWANTRFSFFVTSDGTYDTEDVYHKSSSLSTGTWYHVAVVWDASAASAEFFLNGSSIGTDTATETSIDDNASQFRLGAVVNVVGSNALFLDGKIDDVRVWNDKRTSTEISANYQRELAGNESGLQGYWKLNNSYDDETSNNNDLIASGLPSFSTDVPFEDLTTTSTSTSTTTTSTSITTTSTTETITTTSTSTTTTSTSTTTTSTTTTSTSTTTTSTSTTTTSTTTTLDLRFTVEKVK